MTEKFNPTLDVNSQPYYENNMGFLDQASIGTNSIHSAQQAITDLFEIDLPPLLEGIAEFPPSASILPVAESVHEQIATPFFTESAQNAVLHTADMAAVVQSSATSNYLQVPSVAEDQQQNVSSSISSTSENIQAKTKKASKRKQPEAPKSTKGKREKSTSSIAAASSPETEDPLLPAIQAFQNAKNVKKGCIVKALRNCGMNTRHTERNKLRNYIHAIKACLHYKEIHGTISDKALRDICLKWSVSQSRIAKLLLVAEPKKEVYFKYQKDNLPKIAERKKSTSAKSVGASIEEEDPLVAAMIAFQNDRGINSIAKILSDNGLTSSSTRCELVRRYIYAIGECFLHESDGTISDETLKKNLR